LQAQLADKQVRIQLTPRARAWLAGKGYDPDYGARPLGRLIMAEIGDVLSEEILFGVLRKGGRVKVGLKNEKLSFAFHEN